MFSFKDMISGEISYSTVRGVLHRIENLSVLANRINKYQCCPSAVINVTHETVQQYKN